jgi:hypothetical protein
MQVKVHTNLSTFLEELGKRDATNTTGIGVGVPLKSGDNLEDLAYQLFDKLYGGVEQDNPVIKEKFYNYAEDEILEDFERYIDSTYDAHYSVDGVTLFDAWIALGNADTTARDTALKYLWRYGSKEGKNKIDLFKALHYILFLIYNDHYKPENSL